LLFFLLLIDPDETVSLIILRYLLQFVHLPFASKGQVNPRFGVSLLFLLWFLQICFFIPSSNVETGVINGRKKQVEFQIEFFTFL